MQEIKKSEQESLSEERIGAQTYAQQDVAQEQVSQEEAAHQPSQDAVDEEALLEQQRADAPLIVFDRVEKVYPGDFATLQDITFSIERAEFVAVVGVSGAGKSTLLKMIYAQEHPTDGEVYFGGRPISSIKKHLLPFFRRNFGTVFQDFKLLPQKTVFENVAYALEVQGKSDEQIAQDVPRVLELVGLVHQMEKYPRQISGGEAQRVSLARAVINRPKVLIADEPTGNLDPASTADIMELLLKVNELGTTIILATHDYDAVDALGCRVVTIADGTIAHDTKNDTKVA